MFSKKKSNISIFITKKKNGLILRIRRLHLKLKGNKRPSSYPILTGDSFRALADHIWDETTHFIPGVVNKGDIIFVSQDKALRYLQEIHPEIICPYILIVHNGDNTFDSRHTNLFDQNIIHCFAQNTAVEHEKVTPIPIGLANFHHFQHTDSVYRTPPVCVPPKEYDKRKNRFFYRFFDGTCPSVRVPLRIFCSAHPFAETVSNYLSQESFRELLMRYKFLVSPRGNAIDTHRPYESFHLGIIPVVQDSIAMRALKKDGLPLWVVHDWTELEGITESEIAKKYKDLMDNANFESMHMDFWIDKINKVQKEVGIL